MQGARVSGGRLEQEEQQKEQQDMNLDLLFCSGPPTYIPRERRSRRPVHFWKQEEQGEEVSEGEVQESARRLQLAIETLGDTESRTRSGVERSSQEVARKLWKGRRAGGEAAGAWSDFLLTSSDLRPRPDLSPLSWHQDDRTRRLAEFYLLCQRVDYSLTSWISRQRGGQGRRYQSSGSSRGRRRLLSSNRSCISEVGLVVQQPFFGSSDRGSASHGSSKNSVYC